MNLTQGFKSYFFGMRAILKYPKLRNLALLPLLVDLVIFCIVVYLICFLYLPSFIAGLLANAGQGFWASALAYGAQTIGFIFGLIVSGVVTFALGSWIASPFNALLAEKSLVYFGAKEEAAFSTRRWIQITLQMAVAGMVRSCILLVLGALLFLLSFVPVFHLPVLLLGFFIIATDCLDYSLECLEFDLSARFKYYSRHFSEIFGFSLALGLTFLIPGLSFCLMPAAIVGAAHLAAENKKLLQSTHKAEV